jgi:hypothetical protein
MQDRRLLKPTRRRPPQTAGEVAASLGGPRRRGLPRRMSPELLAALAGTIESVAATAGPVVEATAEAARGDDPGRQGERLAVALRNLETAMSDATVAVRAALEDLDRSKRRPARPR